jgi:hypothetical protein
MELINPMTLDQGLERIVVDSSQDHLPPLTIGPYEALLSKGVRGRNALAAYQHLLYTYRRQGTNQPWATTRYLMNGLGMGRDKAKAAKTLLHEMGLIDYIQPTDAKGRKGKTYTKLNLLPNPGRSAVPVLSPAVDPSYGSETQMLEEETKKRGEKKEEHDLASSSPHGFELWKAKTRASA